MTGPTTGVLAGQVAIVTGATQAMGVAIATRLAAQGAAVVGVGRSVELGRAAAAEITRRGGTAVFERGEDNIRVNTVRLGAVRLPRNAHDHDSHPDLVKEVRMLPRHGSPEDVAAMVAFLAGPDSSWITGEVFVVDGGSASKHRGVNWADVHAAERSTTTT